jgi:hypothetical protein
MHLIPANRGPGLHDIELARISQGRANQFFGRVIQKR